MCFQDIVDLMSMSKDEVFHWWADNYKEMPSEGEKIEKYIDNNNNMCVYFSDLVNPDKIDSIEFDGAVDINGARMNMTYRDVKNALPEDCFEEEIYMEGELVYLRWFRWDDFSVIFEWIDNDKEEMSRIRIARDLSLEDIKPLLTMSEEELMGYYGWDESE